MGECRMDGDRDVAERRIDFDDRIRACGRVRRGVLQGGSLDPQVLSDPPDQCFGRTRARVCRSRGCLPGELLAEKKEKKRETAWKRRTRQ